MFTCIPFFKITNFIDVQVQLTLLLRRCLTS